MTTQIQQRSLWTLAIVGFGALATTGALLAQGQDVDARGQPAQVQETQMLVAHGLAMAIEGSTLESLAMQRGGGGVTATSAVGAGARGANLGPGVDRARTSPGGGAQPLGPIASDTAVTKTAPAEPGGTVSREPYGSDPAARKTEPAGPGGGGAVGTGAGGAGGTVSREPYGSDAATRGTRGANAPTTAGPGAGAPIETGLAGTRASSDPSAMELRRHAKQAFDASDRLMKHVSQADKGRASRFQTAAVQYAASLRRLSEQDGLVGTTPVVVLNHGVKEALESMKLKQMVRMTGISDSPAGQALLAHAHEMDTASKQAVESVLSAGKSGSSEQAIALGANKATGTQGGQLRALALQASEIVMALDELSGEGPAAGKENPKGADSEQKTPKPEDREKQ